MALHPTLVEDLDASLDQLVELYQEFHRTPELSMQEHNTAARIKEIVEGYGYTAFLSGGTGVVATLENGDGPVIAYRADTDGLPIQEDTGAPYASTAEGTLPDGTRTAVMHGCGHDTHISVGLETARLLAAHRDLWAGTVVFLFQPGEETSAGAAAMLEDGLWDKAPRPSAVFGQHVWPGVAGTVNVSVGTAMAMADSLEITVHGKQAHGSQPENSIDPVVLGAFMVTRLQTVVSRETSARDALVLTIATFHAGLKENIIPDKAVFTINMRSFDEGVRANALAAIERIVRAEAAAAGAPEPEIRKMYDFPRVYNEPDLTRGLIAALRDELGEEGVIESPAVTGSEDFGRFGDAIGAPYTYWFFGGHKAESIEAGVAGNHSPMFLPDDAPTALRTGVRAALTALVGHLQN
ncbi:M20 family metallopeptidase [Ornithinimicrobium humiphilum]|uniref:Hippurate hydrolase n=1 Tax=Ornithinimicrobium humiphilum TaxID=125288 RepID=A0A543KL62_9MICO|nr:amidohydrolase [Ornithinimicrobium humiphilum]TQM95826.1 hippurate hydrolase [Ornithinimicrobium humiphilum]